MIALLVVAAVLGVLGLAATAALCVSRVRRLHRLHLRLDAARAALDAALARRAGAAAAAGVTSPAWPGDREATANVLARRLARLDRATLAPPVRAALAEAEELLVLARRVHNDAVRDTLVLRSRRLVRWLCLAGTAPMPAYFETAEPAPDAPGVAATGTTGTGRVGGGGPGPVAGP